MSNKFEPTNVEQEMYRNRFKPASSSRSDDNIAIGTVSFENFRSEDDQEQRVVSDFSREELDAKLERTEARMEALETRIASSLDRVSSEIRESRLHTKADIESATKHLPTKMDMLTASLTWAAVALAVLGITVGGIVGGLSWIQSRVPSPEAPPAAIQPAAPAQ